MTPTRIQRRRTKGFRLPPGTVCCTRPGPLGNPFTVAECREAGYEGTDAEIAERCAEAFRVWAFSKYWRENWMGPESEAAKAKFKAAFDKLKGLVEAGEVDHLACYCPLDKPCHVDVLIEMLDEVERNGKPEVIE